MTGAATTVTSALTVLPSSVAVTATGPAAGGAASAVTRPCSTVTMPMAAEVQWTAAVQGLVKRAAPLVACADRIELEAVAGDHGQRRLGQRQRCER